ncbi:spore germination protein [Paenibacillus sp. MZ04-78.2]|uniref:GerAB/ArcD/ProY family transporter n=1 Tax=Paenibacillus sp. MZ04-78.2 TaxID=2962034 RepID=UPI0020B653CD|nr:endospore germination permease [Paenibacillus sp. MZ04-78.2]MCP3773797.1 spore germination protein [Paenibacillus sp. MZ04-78.2]
MKISGLQLFWLMLSLVTGSGMLFTLSPTIIEAKQDAWIAAAFAGVIGLCIVFLAVKLSLLYPDQTFVQYSQQILGKWLGKIIIVPPFVWLYSLDGMILRDSSEFVYLALFNRTPVYVLLVTLLILAVYVIYTGGIEGIARCSEIMGPLIVLMVVGTCVLSLNHADWHQLTPVYADSGIKSILKGSIPITVFYSSMIFFTMVICFLSDSRQALSRAMWGMAIASFFILVATAMVTMTFGPELASRMWVPFFDMTRSISLLGFIQNVDIVVVIIWLFSVFLKFSLLLFITIYGTAQWLNMRDWRKLMWIVVPIVYGISLLPKNLAVILSDYTKAITPYTMSINVFGIPLLLWIVGTIRQKRANKKVRQR